LDEVYETERSIGWWAEQATRLRAAYHPESYRCDPAEPANIAQLSSSGLPAAKANNEVLPGITAVAGLISNDKLRVHPRCLNTIREFAAYSWKERRGESVPDEPDKCDDHTMDALRYLVMAMIRPSGAGIATGHSNRSKHAQRDHR
jgi:phage terminase large subunit